jgi:hypothetical protein
MAAASGKGSQKIQSIDKQIEELKKKKKDLKEQEEKAQVNAVIHNTTLDSLVTFDQKGQRMKGKVTKITPRGVTVEGDFVNNRGKKTNSMNVSFKKIVDVKKP